MYLKKPRDPQLFTPRGDAGFDADHECNDLSKLTKHMITIGSDRNIHRARSRHVKKR